MKKILIIMSLATVPSFATFLFVPGGFANTDTNSNGISPLSVGSYYFHNGTPDEGQMQQLYDASYFTPLGPSLLISQVAFRNANIDSPYANAPLLADVEVYMDTTSQTVDNMSGNFGANENSPVLVYSGPLQFNIPYDSGDPHCFCYTIPFTTDYTYIPGNGNLLLDIVILQGNDPQNSTLPSLDYQRDGINMAVALNYSSSSDAGVSVPNQGWATQFSYDLGSSAPEPATWVLMGGGMFGLWTLKRRFTPNKIFSKP